MIAKETQSKDIKLDSFLKYIGEYSSGAEAKSGILQGKIKVSGEVCFQRGRKLINQDVVETANGERYKVKVIETKKDKS